MKKVTVWSIFRDYVNSKEIGSIITRQEILEAVDFALVREGQCSNDRPGTFGMYGKFYQ